MVWRALAWKPLEGGRVAMGALGPLWNRFQALTRSRRLTLGLLALAFVATAALPPLPRFEGASADRARAQAFAHWQENGYLKASPETRAFAAQVFEAERRPLALAAIAELGGRARPQDAASREAARATLWELEARAEADLVNPSAVPPGHALQALQYTPAKPRALAALLHPFVHVGWLHFLLLAGFLGFAGMAVERRVGGRTLLGVTAVALALGLGTARLLHPEPTTSFFGAAPLTAALLGFWALDGRARRKAAAADPPPRTRDPLLLVPIAFAVTALLSLAWLNQIGARIDYALAPEFVAGLVGGGFAQRWRGRRFAPDAVRRRASGDASRRRARDAALRDRAAPSPELDEAWVALDMGEVDRAYALFRQGARQHPEDVEVTRALWSVAVSAGHAEDVARTMAEQIRRQLRAGQTEIAADLWCDLVESLPDARLAAEDLFRLVPSLLERHRVEFALAALRQCVDAPRGELSIGLALQILDRAETLDPKTALLAARRALGLTDLHESKRARILERVRELDPDGPEARAQACPAPDPRPEITTPEPEAEAEPDAPIDLAALPRFDALHLVEARPTRFEAAVLYFELAEGRRAKVAWDEIQAVGVAAVRDLAPKPVVVIDLLLNWRELGDAPLRTIRLRSDQFDPGTLVGAGSGATEALRSFLLELIERSGATPLPDEASATGRPFRAYKFTRTYQRRVLKVDC